MLIRGLEVLPSLYGTFCLFSLSTTLWRKFITSVRHFLRRRSQNRRIKGSLKTLLEMKLSSSGMADWILAYSHWYNSPVFLPGLALAILFSNIFQLSYLAQAYSTSHCVSTTFIAVIWIIAGICGFSCMRFMNEYKDFMINNYSFVCSNFCWSYCLVGILG